MPSKSRKMFSKPKSWLSGSIWKPKNPHSLEHLKFLYNLLCKNQTVTEQNRGLLVETLRSISEILIWGDQNDSSVFDFFLEKNMLSFFLRYLQQKFGRYICVQLLQTLNILFENISNETSLYYLLSNNHINSIIVHKFDFSDEEVMAYYISFLKTLSLKLNKHTIHFFYNEHTNDFALYTEAIKFFNHSETMVRIAVRTITLNVFKVDDKAMLSYIRNRTAAPYFSNLVWFIGNHILDLDACVRHDHDHRSRDRLADLVAEHLDHLHYLNDIFLIDIHTLNEVLTDKLLNRLLVPLYVYSLTKRKKFSEEVDDRKHVSCVVSLFLLSQVFLIIRYGPLMQQLAEVIFKGDVALSQPSASGRMNNSNTGIREFRPPRESLEKTLENTRPHHRYESDTTDASTEDQASMSAVAAAAAAAEVLSSPSTEGAMSPASEVCSGDTELSSPTQNSTDEEKLMGRTHHRLIRAVGGLENPQTSFSLDNRPYLESIFNALECSENDYSALFALCLLYAIGKSGGISQTLLDTVLMPTERSTCKENYNLFLVERLIRIIELACQSGNRVRLATLEMSIKLLKQLVDSEERSYLQDRHLACIENAKECCTQLLRNFYKSEEIFLDMFEDEYREMRTRPLNVEYLMQDASILLPPTGTPLTGIDFNKRLPCGEVERARRAIRAFFLVRDLSLSLLHEPETQLPLTKEDMCIKTGDVLDLNNSDLIACTVTRERERRSERRFLVIDPVQLILVEPDAKRLGWGVVKFVGFLQDVEVSGDKDDSRLLHVVVHKPQSSIHAKPVPILSAKMVFDDHIRCMAAKQRLIKGRQRARQQKMNTIERLLDIATDTERGHFTRSGPIPGRSHPVRIETSKTSQPTNIPVSSAPLSQYPSSASISSSSSSHSATTRSGRRVTPEQRRMLQAKAAQRIKSKQNQASQQSLASSGKGLLARDSQGREDSQGMDTSASSDLRSEPSSVSAVQSLNNRPPSGPSSSSGSKLPTRSGDVSNNSTPFEIPLEDLSHKIRGRASSSDRMTAIAIPPRDRYRFQRSLSHSPSRATPKHPDTVTLIFAERKESGRRLSAPVMLSSSRQIPVPVSKVSTATQVGRPHSNSSPVPSNVTVKVEPVRKRFMSGPSPATLRAANSPTTSLLDTSLSPAIPKLLPPNDVDREQFGSDESGIHSTSSSVAAAASMSGARPKQPMMGPYAAKSAARGVNASSSVGMRIQELSLQGLQVSGDKENRKGGKDGGNAISPETPSSDSAVSSDASMISVSSMASESSMDVDSDNNAAGAVAAAVIRGKPASAMQQLTQLAQMVQEHYPYGAADPKKHTG